MLDEKLAKKITSIAQWRLNKECGPGNYFDTNECKSCSKGKCLKPGKNLEWVDKSIPECSSVNLKWLSKDRKFSGIKHEGCYLTCINDDYKLEGERCIPKNAPLCDNEEEIFNLE